MGRVPTSRKPTAGFWIVVALVVLPVLYVLGIGPADWLYKRTPPKQVQQAILVMYYPVTRACDASPMVTAGVRWYASLWAKPDALSIVAGYAPPRPFPTYNLIFND